MTDLILPDATVLLGDCIERMRGLPDRSVQMCVTSPPYFCLRDYGVAGQLGLERTPGQFIAKLVNVFREVRRVLADDGTLWINIGDTANNRRRIRTSSHQPSLNGFKEQSWAQATKLGLTRLSINDGDMKEKDMMGIPWELAFALRADGWYLRQEIIWAKNFGKPEPSSDRLPNRHEQIFLLSKSKRYQFDRSLLPEYAAGSVWIIPPTGNRQHAAAFSTRLVEPCIFAGSKVGDVILDPFNGSGTTGQAAVQHGRRYLGVELNPEYVELTRTRLELVIQAKAAAAVPPPQSDLFAAA